MGKAELKIEIDADLLNEAQAAGLKIDALAESTVRAELARLHRFKGLSQEEKAHKWAEENAEAIQSHRDRIEKFGVFGEDLRTW
ncbi:MAG: hypothetical protein GC203_05985 [Phenylobacterium sp.]|uniref:type II toxin-antitoxin system CcdA family antitoxin n=1 Tax=Phenylobacterium sp. TaxID=1871053 RepID=UPI0025DAFA82|nr:type II toxin-antitoxin system CcdA family antitoxin [Phenylobacterium sp.]MBI1197394.1 hypothetical protein [Phenylobacterium sp.]